MKKKSIKKLLVAILLVFIACSESEKEIKTNQPDEDVLIDTIYGTNSLDIGFSIVKTRDDHLLIFGRSGQGSSQTAHLLKIDTSGNEIFTKTFNNVHGSEDGQSIIEKSNGNYLLVGDVSGSGVPQMWLAEIDPSGDLLYGKTYGNSSVEGSSEGKGIVETSDALWLVGHSFNGTTLLVKADKSGNVLSESIIESFYANSIVELSTGEILLAGETPNSQGRNFKIVKLSKDASILFEKVIVGSNLNSANSLIESKNGNYVITGYTNGLEADCRIVMTDNQGEVIWDKTFDGNVGSTIIEIKDEKFLIAGNIGSDGWILIVNADGNILWQKTYGTTDDDRFYSVTSDDEFFYATGYSIREIEGITSGSIWLVKDRY